MTESDHFFVIMRKFDVDSHKWTGTRYEVTPVIFAALDDLLETACSPAANAQNLELTPVEYLTPYQEQVK